MGGQRNHLALERLREREEERHRLGRLAGILAHKLLEGNPGGKKAIAEKLALEHLTAGGSSEVLDPTLVERFKRLATAPEGKAPNLAATAATPKPEERLPKIGGKSPSPVVTEVVRTLASDWYLLNAADVLEAEREARARADAALARRRAMEADMAEAQVRRTRARATELKHCRGVCAPGALA